MFRSIGGLLQLLALAAVIWLVFFVKAAGVFQTVAPVMPGACREIAAGGIVGVEDLTIDPAARVAYLAGYDRRAARGGRPSRGAIWTLDFGVPDAVPVDATSVQLPGGFQPHGISLHQGQDGKQTLFAINHAGGRHTIEIFDVAGGALIHRRTVTGDALLSPNDIAGVGADAFYVTNDHGSQTSFMRAIEDIGRLRLSTVQFFNGKTFSTVISRIGGANGINVSRDGKSLYVSAALERRVHVFDRDPGTNKLSPRAIVSVPGFADNIELVANGDLLLGVHTKVLEFLQHVRDPWQPSPSHVVWLHGDGNGSFVPETIYYESGARLSGLSVAASLGQRMLLGSIFEHKILDCAWQAGP